MSLDTTVQLLLDLEEKELPSAKSTFRKRGKLRGRVQSALQTPASVSDPSIYAELKPVEGAVSYKKIVECLVEHHSGLENEVEEKIAEYRAKPRYRLVYGRRQLDLFSEAKKAAV